MIELEKPLDEMEQIELLKIKDDPKVKEKLILYNLKLVSWVARKYHKEGRTELEDIFQSGILGLMKAIDKYEPDRGASFSTVAVWYIRSAITRNIYRFSNDISLDDPIIDDEDITLLEAIPDDKVNVSDDVTSKVFMEQFKKEFKYKLDEFQYEIIRLYYGLDCPEHTLKEIAEKHDKNTEQVRQARDKGLRTIRRSRFMDGIRKELDNRTSFIRGKDYSQPKVKGGQYVSSVERIVLEREKIEDKIRKFLERKE